MIAVLIFSPAQSAALRLHITPAIRLVKSLRGFLSATASFDNAYWQVPLEEQRQLTHFKKGRMHYVKPHCTVRQQMSLPSEGHLRYITMQQHPQEDPSPPPPLRFDGHMYYPRLSSLCCQTASFSTNCPLAVIIVFWYNQFEAEHVHLPVGAVCLSVIINVKRVLKLLFSL